MLTYNITVGILILSVFALIWNNFLIEKRHRTFISMLTEDLSEAAIGVQALFESLPKEKKEEAARLFIKIRDEALEEIKNKQKAS